VTLVYLVTLVIPVQTGIQSSYLVSLASEKYEKRLTRETLFKLPKFSLNFIHYILTEAKD
ncbi:MAG: hypothetical protein KAW19_10495, partial [Candidatus Aminicenantes bacterium]|nr:hypothetical protein [Candidatus Aminicenantes bacterium]